MKILQINATYGCGSTGLIVKDIGDAITSSGNEAFFAYQTGSSPQGSGYVIGNTLDWKAHALLCRILGKQGYYSKSPTQNFLNYLDELKPDVVHLHNLHSNFINLNLLLEYLANKNIPTVITMHDCWYFTGKCFHYVDAGCQKFMTDCKGCPKKNAPPRSYVFDCADTVLKDRQHYLSKIPRLRLVGCSDWICAESKKGILKDCISTRIYNGVDTEIFKPYNAPELIEQYGIKSKRIVLGMANKWLSASNKVLLNKTVSTLPPNSVLMLIGCTDQQKQALSQYKNVVAVGFINDRELLARHYSIADAFVNATHADTLPTVNMESICCGTPVITYDSCGSPELVAEGCGIVITENDVDAMVNAICTTTKADYPSCSETGIKLFNKKTCYDKYIDIYKEFI